MASSLPFDAAGVAPEDTVAAVVVVPVACDWASSTDASVAADSPEYSSAATPTSAADVTCAVITGFVPPPAVTGALHTLSSVLSGALK